LTTDYTERRSPRMKRQQRPGQSIPPRGAARVVPKKRLLIHGGAAVLALVLLLLYVFGAP